jgi:hypothetical protein
VIDAEEARLELARRFLRFLGPARPERLCKWASRRKEAFRTWAPLSAEPVEIDVGSRSRFMLEADVDRILATRPPEGVRLLPLREPSSTTTRTCSYGSLNRSRCSRGHRSPGD